MIDMQKIASTEIETKEIGILDAQAEAVHNGSEVFASCLDVLYQAIHFSGRC